MKVALDTLKIGFLTIGSAIGAGFVSGRELVRFFGGAFLLPACFFTAALFGASTFLILSAGRRFGGSEGLLRAAFGRAAGAARAALLLGSLVVVAAMLAGSDALFAQAFSLPRALPAASLLVLAAGAAAGRKGVDGLSRCNLFLVPVMLAVIFGFVLSRGAFPVETEGERGAGVLLIACYSAMNLFLASPVLADAGAKYDRRAFAPAAALSGLAIGLAAFLILGALRREGASAMGAPLPLLYLFSEPIAARAVFSAVILLGIVTTEISSYYPLLAAARPHGKAALFALAAISFALSRFGLGAIVNVLYPALGFLGLVYLAFLALALARGGEKRGPGSENAAWVRKNSARGEGRGSSGERAESCGAEITEKSQSR